MEFRIIWKVTRGCLSAKIVASEKRSGGEPPKVLVYNGPTSSRRYASPNEKQPIHRCIVQGLLIVTHERYVLRHADPAPSYRKK